MSIMVRGATRGENGIHLTLCTIYPGQTRAKKVSDLKEYDVVITTHAVCSLPICFYNRP